MYEDRTYDALLSEALGAIQSDVLKSEGSLVYNTVSALAFELNRLYIQLDYLITQMNPETADFEMLSKLAAQRAVYPSGASACTVEIKTNVAVPVGTRFSMQSYTFAVTEALDDGNYAARCEQTGSAPNTLRGSLTVIDYVDGLTTASIVDLLVAGTDADGRDELYKKYLASFSSLSFGGNIAAYKEKLNSIDGIGGTKVYPVWQGAGTVKCVMIGSDWRAISGYLLERVEAEIQGDKGGYGFAPINHTVTLQSVKEVSINVNTFLTFSSGYSWAACKDAIIEAIDGYIISCRKTWGDGTESDYITVYISRLESAVLDVQGVLDISGTTLNGSGANLALPDDEVPVLGEVTPV